MTNPPGVQWPAKPGLDHDRNEPNRKIRRHMTSPCNRPPATPTNVQIKFRAREAKTHLEFSGRITWDDVTTDTSGFPINTIDRWDVRWRAVDLQGDPIPVEHAALKSATNPTGSVFEFTTQRNTDWQAGDRVKVANCFPETNYNGTWTISTKVSASVFRVTGGVAGTPDAKRPGEVYNQSTDRLYERHLRNPQHKVALRKAEFVVLKTDHHNVGSITNPSGTTYRVNTGSAHGRHVNDYVKIEGASPNAYNGVWKVTSIVDADTYQVQGDTGSLGASGSADEYLATTAYQFTTRGDNGFNAGQRTTISGNRPEVAYNGTWNITNIIGTDQFQVQPNRNPDNPLNNAETLGYATDEDDKLDVVIHHVSRPRSWQWQAQVRVRSGQGCWSAPSAWTTPVLPWDGADPQPPVPTFGLTPIDFDHKGKGKHAKVRLLFTFDEVQNWDVPGGDRESDVQGYDVALDTSDDGVNWDGSPFRIHKISAKQDTDNDNTVTAVFHNGIHRHHYYRCKVRTRDRFNRKGPWSNWTAGAVPFDDTEPPTPLLVATQALHDRIRVDWNPPTINLPIRGTGSVSAGGTTVTGSGTHFNQEAQSGLTLQIGSETRLIKRVVSSTSLIVGSAFSSSHTDQALFIIDEDPDVAGYEAQMANATDVDFSTSPYSFNVLTRDWRGTSDAHDFRIPIGREEEQWYMRARSFDAARNRSDWVYATAAGNSSTSVNPEPASLIRDVVQADWRDSGNAEVGTMTGMWRADRDYRFVRIRAVCGVHNPATHPDDGTPGGQALRANVHRIKDIGQPSESDDVVINSADKLSIETGNHSDSVNPGKDDFDIAQVLLGEYLYCAVTQIGNGPPGNVREGRVLRIIVTMVPLQF